MAKPDVVGQKPEDKSMVSQVLESFEGLLMENKK